MESKYKPIMKKKAVKPNWVTVFTTTINKADGSQIVAEVQQETNSKAIRTVEVD